MITVEKIFDDLNGPAAFARALKIKPSAASEMKRRESIPVRYWPDLIKVMEANGKPITYDKLVAAHAKKRKRERATA